MAVNQWDKGSKNNGPNAHKKGNRTKGQPRNGKQLGDISKAISEDISRYKEIAEKVRRSKKYRQEDLHRIYQGLIAYIDRQKENEKPITVSGMILASGISSATWYEMLGGDYDYRLYEYIDMHNINTNDADIMDDIPFVEDENGVILLITYSDLLQKAMLLQQEQTEERLYEKGRVGDIFALKAMHGWQEETSPHTVNQTLVLASPEQAREAIKMLG